MTVNEMPSSFIPALSFLLLGVLVAEDMRMGENGVAGLAVGLGLIHGLLDGAAMREGAGALGLLGIMAMPFALVALASAIVVSLERFWERIAIRVAGNWTFAGGLLMLGWTLKGWE